MKALKWILGGAAAIVVLLLVVGFLFLNPLVEKGIETAGPAMLKAPVTVGAVRLSPFTGNGTITGLVVGNPEGFKTPHALKLDRVHVDVSLSSLFTDNIVVRQIRIDSPEITYELGDGGSNIARLQKNLEELAGAPSGGREEEKEEREGSAAPEEGKRVRIDDLLITDGKVNLAATALEGQASIPLPEIRMQEIGEDDDQGGLTLGETLTRVFTKVSSGVGEAVKGKGTETLKEKVKEGLGDLFDKRKN